MLKLIIIAGCSIYLFISLAKTIQRLPLNVIPSKYIYGYYITLLFICASIDIILVIQFLGYFDMSGVIGILILIAIITLHCVIRRNR